MSLSNIDLRGRGSTTEPDTPSPRPDIVRYVLAHLIPLSEAGRLAIENARKQNSTYHSRFIADIEYPKDVSTPCFEIAFDDLPDFSNKRWNIGTGRSDLLEMGVEFLLNAEEPDKKKIAGVHARFSWVPYEGQFSMMVRNQRSMRCNVNGDDMVMLGDARLIPSMNTILIGELPFTLQYVQPDHRVSRVRDDNSPPVSPTPQELDQSFGDWRVQHPIEKGTFGTVYMVVHSFDGRKAAAKQIFKTKCNAVSIEREVGMVTRISELSHHGIASPFQICRVRYQTKVEIARIRKHDDDAWKDNIISQIVIFSPFIPVTLRIAIESPATSEITRSVFFEKILSGVAFLHKNGITHRDLQPDNILVESFLPAIPKITNFGRASAEVEILHDWPDTTPYLAPEQVEGKYHGRTVDEWACGLIGYALLHKQSLQVRVLPGLLHDAMLQRLLDFECVVRYMPLYCTDLLTQEPMDRMTAKQAFDLLKNQENDTDQVALLTEQSASGSMKRVKLE